MTAILILLLAGLAGFGLWARKRARDLRMHARFRSDYFDAAKVLIDDERTPESVVEMVEKQAASISDGRWTWRLMRDLFSGRVRRVTSAPNDKARRLLDDLSNLPPELMKPTAICFVTYVLALSYNSSVAGWVLRRVALFGLNQAPRRPGNDDGQARALVLDLAERQLPQAA